KVQWSHRTHGAIAENAIQSLPSPWKEFFQNYSDVLSIHSDDPDQYRSYVETARKDLFKAEEPRHFDDHNLKEFGGTIYDEWASENAHLIDGKITQEDAEFFSVNVSVSSKKYQKGVIEWTTHNFTKKVTEYMSVVANDPSNNTAWQLVLIHMGWLCHYASDATMPFHGTANYDGQYTGQSGIHGLVENSMIDNENIGRLDDVNFTHRPAIYVASPYNQTASSIEGSLGNVSFILETDKEIAPGGARKGTWVDDMWATIGEMMSGRIDLAARNSANLWYTALVDSGLMTTLNSTDLASIIIDVSGMADPWIPPLPPKPAPPTTTSSSSNQASSGFEIFIGFLSMVCLGIILIRNKKR
ncbi:MAG: zinc dependent phospholipase C family protein, partial [Candidatus Thorarchaeota archaeon]